MEQASSPPPWDDAAVMSVFLAEELRQTTFRAHMAEHIQTLLPKNESKSKTGQKVATNSDSEKEAGGRVAATACQSMS